MSSPVHKEVDVADTGGEDDACMNEHAERGSSPLSSPARHAAANPAPGMPAPPNSRSDEQNDAVVAHSPPNTSISVAEIESDPLSNPEAQIEEFGWRHLQERYHFEMQDINRKEHDIMAEFDGLCQYFSTWAQAGTTKEDDRTFKRLKTQMALVRHHEDELERRREHYIRVVDAFKSALRLLAT